MEGNVDGESNLPWFSENVETWASQGWEISGIEKFLNENSQSATESLLRVEYLVNLSNSLRDRLDFEWLEKNELFNELFSNWLERLHDPMNGDIIQKEYDQ